MEIILIISIISMIFPIFGELSAYSAVHSEPKLYSYRQYSRFNEWYTQKFFKRAWKTRIQMDTAWLEHDLDTLNHRLNEDCFFCKPKETEPEVLKTYNQIRWELQHEPRRPQPTLPDPSRGLEGGWGFKRAQPELDSMCLDCESPGIHTHIWSGDGRLIA